MKNSLIVLTAMLSMSLGFNLGQRHSDLVPVREELLGQMRSDQSFLAECTENLKNQFTPGYRAFSIFSRLDDSCSRLNSSQGQLFKTGTATDLAVNGSGFFVTERGGERFYTRDGRFSFQDGNLVNRQGCVLLTYRVNPRGQRLGTELAAMRQLSGGKNADTMLDEHGLIGRRCELPDVNGEKMIFQVALAGFEHPENLKRCQDTTLLQATKASGEAKLGWARRFDFGEIEAGTLELSNVDPEEQAHVISALKLYAGLNGSGPSGGVTHPKLVSELQRPLQAPAYSLGVLGYGGILPAPNTGDLVPVVKSGLK